MKVTKLGANKMEGEVSFRWWIIQWRFIQGMEKPNSKILMGFLKKKKFKSVAVWEDNSISCSVYAGEEKTEKDRV